MSDGPTDFTAPDFEEVPRSSWLPIDLASYIDGSYTPPLPSVLLRTDGCALLYPGRVHWFHGESESGKSWVVQIAAVEVLAAGGKVLYVDFESTPDEIVSRLLLLGASPEDLAERFFYVSPAVSSDKDSQSFSELLSVEYTLAVVDGVTEALGLYGASSNDADNVTAWGRKLPRRIARETGAAVACIDHVTKSEEGRGRFAFGSQAKLALLDGAAYTVEPKELAPGKTGYLVLRVAKDRAGAVRKHAGPYRAADRTQEAARIRFDSTDSTRIKFSVEPFAAHVDPETGKSTFRPTYLMERVSAYIQANPDQPKKEITNTVPGTKQTLGVAVDVLFEEGYIKAIEYTSRGGTGKRYQHIRAYREAEDPQSDKFVGSSEVPRPGSFPKGGRTGRTGSGETTSDPVREPGSNPVELGSEQGKHSEPGPPITPFSKITEPGPNRVDISRSFKDQLQGSIPEAAKINNGVPADGAGDVRNDRPSETCERCRKPAQRLIKGWCPRCSYRTETHEEDPW